jgi:phage I-like protein
MNHFNLYNTAHPMAEGGRPIFVPFGEWPYDRARRQRLDRAHGEAIANELNARVARGEPGIPVYQGHPDVPELAARYPDKGAVGWVTRIDLANEGGRDGLALTVEWDRDPGRGFRWFSPYWTASAAPDGVCVVEAIQSVGLVNNPNIPDFRLANEKDLNQTPAEQAPTKEHTMDIEAIKKALGLPPEATEEQVMAAIEAGAKAVEELAIERTKAEAAEAEKGQAESERDEAKAELANERAARSALLLDQAIAEGRISVAGRAAWEKRLRDDFAAGSVALANEKPLKTESAVKAAPGRRASVDLVALANEKMGKNPSMSYSAAFAAAMKEHPEVK